MFTQIMVPLDGSALAEQALPCAAELAGPGTTVHLVRVVERPSAVRQQGIGAPVNVYEEIIAVERQQAEMYLEDVRLRSRLDGGGRTVVVRCLDGDTPIVLIDYVREAGIDLAVMTTHGGSGLMRWALGSVADRHSHRRM